MKVQKPRPDRLLNRNRRDKRRSTKRALEQVLKDFQPQGGSFDTSTLVSAEITLRALGWARTRAQRAVYRPFILMGRADWSDSWGAPRFGPAPGQVRSHEGQDVFCREGQPVLASERGTVEFAEGGLGGKIARLHRGDGTYWYYAHLSRWNTRRFKSGDSVKPGDVIGYCGSTGDAVGGAPHVHFGYYVGGEARDPLPDLARWLKIAEQRATNVLDRALDRNVSTRSIRAVQRHFGDELNANSVPAKRLPRRLRLGAVPGLIWLAAPMETSLGGAR